MPNSNKVRAIIEPISAL